MIYLEYTLQIEIKKLPNQKHTDYDFFAKIRNRKIYCEVKRFSN